MFGWSIASRSKPNRTGDQSDHSTRPKRGTPSIVDHQVGDERRREAGTGSDPSEDPAVGDSALVDRNPAREKLIRGRIDDGLARAEKEANRHEQEQGAGDIRRNKRGEGRKDSPPDHSAREHDSRAETVGESAANRLKQALTQQHRAEDLAQLHVREVVGIDDGPARDRDVDAVQIRYGAEDKQARRPETSARVLFSRGA